MTISGPINTSGPITIPGLITISGPINNSQVLPLRDPKAIDCSSLGVLLWA